MPPADFHDWMEGRTIVFMWHEGISVPLWAEGGHLPEDPEWLTTELGLSDALIAALSQWGRDMQAAHTHTRSVTQEERRVRERSKDLLARLRDELAGRFIVVVGPGDFDEAGD